MPSCVLSIPKEYFSKDRTLSLPELQCSHCDNFSLHPTIIFPATILSHYFLGTLEKTSPVHSQARPWKWRIAIIFPLCAQLSHDITSSVDLRYQLPPEFTLLLGHSKQPSGSSMQQELPVLEVLGNAFSFLTPRVSECQNIAL